MCRPLYYIYTKRHKSWSRLGCPIILSEKVVMSQPKLMLPTKETYNNNSRISQWYKARHEQGMIFHQYEKSETQRNSLQSNIFNILEWTRN